MFHKKHISVKKTVIFLGLALLVACQSTSDVKKKEKELARYKSKVFELNMQIKKLEKELSGVDTVKVNLIPVRTLTLKPVSFSHYVEASGTTIPEKEAFISAEINGQIKKIYVVEGQRVRRNELLLKLNTDITESSIAEAKARLQLTEKLYRKQKELWSQKVGSEVQYLQAKTNLEAARERLRALQAQLDMAYIKAPFDGIIDEVYAKEGELAVPGRQLVQLINLSRMKIYADVSEVYLSSIHKGETVTVVFPDLGNRKYPLPVFRKANVINDKTRTFRIEMKVDNPGWELKPNLYTLVRFRDYHNPASLVVPSEIIKKDIRGYFLYRLKEEKGQDIAEKVYVTPGVFYKDMTEVKKGLSAGDRIIVAGYDQVTNGEIVKLMQ